MKRRLFQVSDREIPCYTEPLDDARRSERSRNREAVARQQHNTGRSETRDPLVARD
jgi:hypothetical protein